MTTTHEEDTNGTTQRQTAARDKARRTREGMAAWHGHAIRGMLPLFAYAGCEATIEGVGADARVTFTSPRTGTHSLHLESTGVERAVAHWEGFVAGVNGGEWATVRPLRRGEAVDCMGEGCHPTPSGGYAVCTDFGCFCSGACAEHERRARLDFAREAEQDA